MYGLKRLNSANHLRALFANPRTLLGLNPIPPLGSFSLTHFSSATIGDSVNAGEEGKICGKDENNTYKRRVLPPELRSNNVTVLTCDSDAVSGICDVYLVGTCHVCAESKREVESVIRFLKPQVVFLELCSSRKGLLRRKSLKVPTMEEMVALLQKENANHLAIVYSWYIANVGSELGVIPGGEFLGAYEEAIKYGGKVILGDRPINITLRRIWANMSFRNVTKLMYAFLSRDVPLSIPGHSKGTDAGDMLAILKGMNNVDLVKLIDVLSKKYPTIMEPLLHERDKYMSAYLLDIGRKHNSIVAVVGKAHLHGIQKNWKQPVEVMQLLSIPTKNNTSRVGSILGSIGTTVKNIISRVYRKK